MADVAWDSSVLSTGKLNIDAASVHGVWHTAISTAIRELNTLFSSNNVNVSLAVANPAVVKVALTTGSYSFPVNGVNQTGTLRTDILHGVTRSLDLQLGRNTTRQQAFVFLPQHPKTNPQARNSREVGEPVMRVIAAHEFLHALGLDVHDPSFNGLFAGSWTLNEGGRASSDTVSPFGGSAKLPPLILSGDTISRLQALWP
jgi:hypothetical protein